jgi:hypothetical protein
VRDAADTILELGGNYTPTGTWTNMVLTSPTASTVEMGAGSTDTTITRSSAGIIAVEGTTVPLNSTTNIHTAQQIELGAASDTTLARVSAGLASIEGNNVFTLNQGLPKVNMLNGITNANSARQSQVVVSATAYYMTSSNLNLPASLKDGMIVGTRFKWHVVMDKTAAGTGTSQIIIYRGTNGSTSDTADVTQTLGTQTAVVDNLVMDVSVVVTATGATGSYYWSICAMQKAATITGFGIPTGTTGLYSGTVSSVAMNTSALIFGLGFKMTTGTPTISIPLIWANAENID